MSVEMVRVSVGRYTVIQDSEGYLYALRDGETWRDLSGDKLMLAMAQEVERLRALSQPVGAGEGNVPKVQATSPKRIWLAVADDKHYADEPFPEGVEEICWSHDAPLEVCVPYIRADLAAPAAEDARDAARYRWLRDHRDEEGFVDPEIHVAVDSHKFPNQWALVGEDLDAAIDAAMSGDGEVGCG